MNQVWLAIIGAYAAIIVLYGFAFQAWRSVSNHLDERLKRIEEKVSEIAERTSKMEGRLDK